MLMRCVALLLATVVPAAAQQPVVQVREAGPGPAGVLLRAAAGEPHHTVRARPGRSVHLPRDTTFGSSVLVLDGDATVGATVRGDVIVVGGDLFLHQGADIAGRAVAIGGGVYGSTLASVRGGELSFRDAGFHVQTIPTGFALRYRSAGTAAQESEVVTLPFLYGIRMPEYTRVDGLVLPWGPRVTIPAASLLVDPLVTYHSDLGEFDPSVRALWQPGATFQIEGTAQRATFSNDRWIRPDLVNSLTTLVAGRDYRNYYRADRFEITAQREWQVAAGSVRTSLGARTERASSVTAGGPWSMFSRQSERAMDRPNPAVLRGRITSALAGIDGQWEAERLLATAAARVEAPFDTPDDGDWVQLTGDATVVFPTFGTQSFEFGFHAVVTPGDPAPPQRFAYLGGSGTIPTLRALERGGDHLLFFESGYNVPITPLLIPIVGPPTVSLRHVIGAAGVGGLPEFDQNIGLTIGVSTIELEFMVDPANGATSFSLGSRRVR